jgi:HJR/Mrr/RecB family endonuclease
LKNQPKRGAVMHEQGKASLKNQLKKKVQTMCDDMGTAAAAEKAAELAEKEGVTYAIQCKCYTAPIGVKAIQEAYAGRDYYDRMVGAVLTNQYFTTPAVEAAKKLKILLWDRGYLESMIEEEV